MLKVLHQPGRKKRRQGTAFGAHTIEDANSWLVWVEADKWPPLNGCRANCGGMFQQADGGFYPLLQGRHGFVPEIIGRLVAGKFPFVRGTHPKDIIPPGHPVDSFFKDVLRGHAVHFNQ